MTQHSTEPAAKTTRALLACGVAAGPIFVAVALTQAATRTGFEPARHPLSLLSLGGPGWIQISNFVLVGLLFVAAAAGLRKTLHHGAGAKWTPRLFATFGVSLIGGGVFVADPVYGFPLGTPPGGPQELSWHGILHGFAPAIGFLALSVACFVLARRFTATGSRGWAAYGYLTGVAVLVLSAVPMMSGNPEGNFLPMWAGMVLAFTWASATIARLRSTPADPPVSCDADVEPSAAAREPQPC